MQLLKIAMRKILDKLVRPFGLAVVTARETEMTYFHHYKGGYEEYKNTQIFFNKKKLKSVWADETTLGAVVNNLKSNGLGVSGICHGARNGFEVEYFRNHLDSEVIGTDISDTAKNFPNMVVWDYHDQNPKWVKTFDFVYSNSLDQALHPEKALKTWANQLNENGRIYIEHTIEHSTRSAGAMDPFGADRMVMPFLFFDWGKGIYTLEDIIKIPRKKNYNLDAWVFVLRIA